MTARDNQTEIRADLLRATTRGWAGMITGQAGLVRLIAYDLDAGISDGAVEDLRIAADALLDAAAAIDRLAGRIGGDA